LDQVVDICRLGVRLRLTLRATTGAARKPIGHSRYSFRIAASKLADDVAKVAASHAPLQALVASPDIAVRTKRQYKLRSSKSDA
jgi:hypothetical protein